MHILDFHISKLDCMKKYPKQLFCIGDTSLLKKPTISIVGSRKPNSYAKQIIANLTSKLSNTGVCIVSGGAIGIDAIVHKNTKDYNTIMVAGTGLDIRYPAINKNMIKDIEECGLVISQFSPNTPSLPRNFAIRNELIVALGDILIVAYADINSGTTRSIKYALKMGKKIYVLPHRIGQSDGTNDLLSHGLAKAIYDIDKFVSQFGIVKSDNTQDDFLEYCQTNPTYDETIARFGSKVFEYELSMKIKVDNGIIWVL